MNFSLDLILEVTTIINHNLAAVSFSTILQSTFTPAFMMLSSLTMAVQLAGKQMRLINFIKCNPFVFCSLVIIWGLTCHLNKRVLLINTFIYHYLI